jgi:kumamolisin
MIATVRLAGSARPEGSAAANTTVRPLTGTELAAPAVVTLHLREDPRTDGLAVRLARQHLSTGPRRRHIGAAELTTLHGAAAADVASVSSWATAAGLRVHRREGTPATVDVSGSLATLARAFGVELEGWRVRDPRTGAVAAFRDHRDELSIPARLDGLVTAALGLSDRPLASSRLATLPLGVTAAISYTPEELAAIYDFPVLQDGGAGTTITVGIAELGGAVHRADLAVFTAANPRLRVIEEAAQGWGPTSDPGGADVEVALDWQVIAGVFRRCAPQADVNVVIKYAANTDRGFTNLIESFATDGRNYTAVSTSWGAIEDRWTPAAMDVMDRAFQMGAVRGIVHSVAAGDNGSSALSLDGRQHADFPASAPHAVGCGGTTLIAEGGVRLNEVAWNEIRVGQGATGGGVSAHFPVPRYQSSAGVRPVSASGGAAGRGVPDVAANADPLTGYVIHYRGVESVVGGTSAVSPLWTALFALASASTGHRLGDVLPGLYAARLPGFTDITTGDNGGYRAQPGWDAATGLGVPSGRALCETLRRSLVLPGPAHRLRSPDRGGVEVG